MSTCSGSLPRASPCLSVKDIALLGGWQMAGKVVGKLAGQHQCLAGGWDTPTTVLRVNFVSTALVLASAGVSFSLPFYNLIKITRFSWAI